MKRVIVAAVLVIAATTPAAAHVPDRCEIHGEAVADALLDTLSASGALDPDLIDTSPNPHLQRR